MANLSDVEDTLAALVTGYLYPDGASNPSLIPSVNNIYIYAGWPRPIDLENDIKINNNAHVTIFPSNTGRNTTRFPQNWIENMLYPATLTLALVGNQVTVGGLVSTPQACMIIVNGIGYAYQVLDTDTLDTIASSLATQIPNSSALNNVIMINGAHSIVPRVTFYGSASKEIKRQEVIFNFITWTNTRDKRTQIADVIEKGLGGISRFTLPDNYTAMIFYTGLRDHDEFEKQAPIYRRDLMFRIEYPTTITDEFASISDVVTNISLVNQLT
jgi:hypothetical protein